MSKVAPPSNPEVEEILLALILTNTEAFLEASEKLSPDDFSTPAFQDIFQSILNVDKDNKPIDVVTISADLKKQRKLARIGGLDSLLQLQQKAIDEGNHGSYIDIILDKSTLRKLNLAGRFIVESSLNPSNSSEHVLDVAEKEIFNINASKKTDTLLKISETMPQTLSSISEVRTSSLLGKSTGFQGLDELTGGMQPGQLWVLAARPGMGKSALALQIASSVAEQDTEFTVAFLSYEMTRNELALRLLAQKAKVDLLKLQRGDIPLPARKDVAYHADFISKLPLAIDDTPPDTIIAARSLIRRFARRNPLALVVVDYIQLISSEPTRREQTRAEEVGEISRGLKRLSNELSIPILALSQLNRKVEERVNKRPQLSDLRDSGAVEQDANIVLMLHRPSIYDASISSSLAECLVAKNRNGPTGVVNMQWEPVKGARFVSNNLSSEYSTPF
jgi:replicative DNA helicase